MAQSSAWSPWPCTLVWVCVMASSVYLLPVRLEIKVEVLVVVGLCLRLLQVILGPMRRNSREQNVQYAAMAAYYLPSFLAFSAASTLASSSDSNLYYIMWCLLLLMFSAFGRAEMRVYTLTAGANQRWVLLKWFLYLSWVQVGLIWTDQKLTLYTFLCFLLSLLWFLGILSAKPQVGTLDSNSKPFADYMKREYKAIITFKGEPNSICMYGSKYPLVLGHNGQMVTIGNTPHKSALTADDEDMMLAYSYSQLLARRYFGFDCAEENCPDVRAFALALLQQGRAFKIIEVQLAFLHDYFFAAYGHIVWSSFTCSVCGKDAIMIKLLEIILALKVVLAPIGIMVWSYILFIVGGTFGSYKACFHVVATLLLVLLKWFYAKPVVPNYWDSIQTAFWINCSSVHKFVRWCRSPHYCSHTQPYWQEKIGQYSLMEDYDRSSCKNTIIALFKEHVLGQVSHNSIEHYPVEDDPVSLPESVKECVARWLLVLHGRPTNGKTSLKKNGVLDDFGYTLKEQAHTRTILIWHIATWYCSKLLPVEENVHAEVAEALSKYCAYLVAFLPELLPDHCLGAKVLQQVIRMAKDKHDEIQDFLLVEEEHTPSENSQEASENLQEPCENSQMALVNSQMALMNSHMALVNSHMALVNSQEPSENSQQPCENLREPYENSQGPTKNSQEPIIDILQNEEEHTPSENSQESCENSQEPCENSQTALVNSHMALMNCHMALVNSHMALVNSHMALMNSQEPSENSQEPCENSREPSENSQEHIIDILRNEEEHTPSENSQEPSENLQEPYEKSQDHIIHIVPNEEEHMPLPSENSQELYENSQEEGHGANLQGLETRMTMNQKHILLDDEEHGDLLSENSEEEQHSSNHEGLQPPLPYDESILNTFGDGINLGQQLVARDSIASNEENHVSSWEVMADFWAETILYVAPSANAAAHIEQLAKGGEFVTHLWALLSNAGIYKREC